MNILTKLLRIFWNPSERRLRSLWRLGLHTSLVLLLTTVFTIGFMSLTFLLAGSSGGGFLDGLPAGPIQWAESSWINRVIGPLATFCGVVLATFLAGHWIDRRKFKKFGLSFTKDWWIDFAFGLGLGAGLMSLAFLVGWLTGSIRVGGFFCGASARWGILTGLHSGFGDVYLCGDLRRAFVTGLPTDQPG